MKLEHRIDPLTSRAAEDAEGIEVFEEEPPIGLLQLEHEEAQGVEVFESPDAVVPAAMLREGREGEEMLTGDAAGMTGDEDSGYEEAEAAQYPEA